MHFTVSWFSTRQIFLRRLLDILKSGIVDHPSTLLGQPCQKSSWLPQWPVGVWCSDWLADYEILLDSTKSLALSLADENWNRVLRCALRQVCLEGVLTMSADQIRSWGKTIATFTFHQSDLLVHSTNNVQAIFGENKSSTFRVQHLARVVPVNNFSIRELQVTLGQHTCEVGHLF